MSRPPEPGDENADAEGFRAGFCAIVGLPNVGKSTLLNRLVGRKLGIVTPKAQTTRRRLRAIFTDQTHQAVFVDTPGLLEPRYPLQEAMQEEAREALRDADVVLLVVDAGFERSVEEAQRFSPPDGRPGILSLNKVDRVSEERRRELEAAFRGRGWDAVISTVATEGRGVRRLREALLERLPESPAFYPRDQVAAASLRFLTEELVRETCLEELAEEVPYSVAVRVEEFREAEEPVYIAADLFVERDSQKGILIGEGGRMIRRIGSRARRKVEDLLDERVYLDLRVKVAPKWRKRLEKLEGFGFRAPRR